MFLQDAHRVVAHADEHLAVLEHGAGFHLLIGAGEQVTGVLALQGAQRGHHTSLGAGDVTAQVVGNTVNPTRHG